MVTEWRIEAQGERTCPGFWFLFLAKWSPEQDLRVPSVRCQRRIYSERVIGIPLERHRVYLLPNVPSKFPLLSISC
jgi:hypothetical protein